jgi:hypothetical protein
MTKHAPPPSPDLTEAEIDALMMTPLSDDEFGALLTGATEAATTAPAEVEMISVADLLLLNIETRIGRIATACETSNKIKAASRDNITELTAQVNRLADALDSIAAVFGCITESVEGSDGVSRCIVRTRDTAPHVLSFRNDGSED